MNVVAVRASRARGLRVAVTAETAALCMLAVAIAAFVALTWATWGNPGRDTGYDLVAGARVAHGDLPYVDFTYYYGPLAPLGVGLFMWVGGVGLNAAVAFGLLLAIAAVLLTYALARIVARPAIALIAALIAASAAFAPTNYSFVTPHTYAAPLGIVGLLGCAFAGTRYSATSARRWLVAAGLGLAVVLLSRPEFGAAGLAGAALWLVARRRSGAGRAHEVGIFTLASLGTPLMVYAAFAAATSVHRLLFENLYPRAQLQAGANEVLRSHAPLTASSFVDLAGKTALYALGAACLVAAGYALERRRGLRLTAAAIGVLCVALAAMRAEATRHGLEYVYGWIPAGAAVAAAILAFAAVRGRIRGLGQEAALLVVVPLAILAAKEYASFFVDAPRPQPAVYALPLAALFLVALHLRLAGRSRWAQRIAIAWLAFIAAATVGLGVKGRARRVGVHPRAGRHPAHGDCRRTRVPADARCRSQPVAGRRLHSCRTAADLALPPERPAGSALADFVAPARSPDGRRTASGDQGPGGERRAASGHRPQAVPRVRTHVVRRFVRHRARNMASPQLPSSRRLLGGWQ